MWLVNRYEAMGLHNAARSVAHTALLEHTDWYAGWWVWFRRRQAQAFQKRSRRSLAAMNMTWRWKVEDLACWNAAELAKAAELAEAGEGMAEAGELAEAAELAARRWRRRARRRRWRKPTD